MAEHWMYLPSIGLFTLLAMGISKIYRRASGYYKYTAISVSISLIIFWGALTIIRNYDWREPLLLYQKDARLAQNSFILHNNLGVEYFRRGRFSEAELEFQKSLQICDHYATARNNLGAIYERQGKLQHAITEYQKAIDVNDYGLAYSNLGSIYLRMSRLDEAIEVFKKGLKIYPQYVEIHFQLGLAYFQKGYLKEAKKVWEKTLLLDSNYLPAKKALSVLE